MASPSELRLEERIGAGQVPQPTRVAGQSAWLRLYTSGLALMIPLYHGSLAGLALLSFAGGGWLRWFGDSSRGARRKATAGWAGFLRKLGVPESVRGTEDPEARIGPLLGRDDAKALFTVVGQAARRVGADFPSQVRLSYLPCCGVLDLLDPTRWNARRQVLVIGLPLLSVLSVDELRAVVAHELVHLSRGDAAAAGRVTRFLVSLQGAASGADVTGLNPLVLYTRGYRAAFRTLAAPVARRMEFRADRVAGSALGANILGSALLKTAVVQSVFKEVLEYYHPTRCGQKSLYQFFRAFWKQLPAEQLQRLEQSALMSRRTTWFDHHPCLADRIDQLNQLAHRPETDARPACRLIESLDSFEMLLHNRIYRERQETGAVQPSTFHKAGS